ncbi:glycoside hydrolase family 13 protein [Arthrobacter castelli]|uniref:glycoside hydrolase family 13 protein n=1 Tax=Arthrobacter castelli TaxID=271431 RepID=UPI000416F2B1|nr:glycoside hydrolase family 13 protein [Arthrobacter castelli]
MSSTSKNTGGPARGSVTGAGSPAGGNSAVQVEPAFAASTGRSPWWSTAVIYQIYPRSFSDADGNGMGDLKGVTDRLPYLSRLGIDAVWISPFYVSPQADAGYDVADYRDVDPRFGTLTDFDQMLAAAHERGIRVIVDLVPNHTSDQHAWFRQALESGPGSAARDRYMFRDGRGEHGELPPNNWQSVFGGPAWTRLEEADDGAATGPQWYLHLFDARQPDLNWQNEEVRQEMVSILRFWLDRGVDGFRIDVAHGLVKAEGLPDWAGQAAMVSGESSTAEATNVEDEEEVRMGGSAQQEPPRSPMFDQEGVHDIYRQWNEVLAEYHGDRMLVAEAWVEPAERLARYIRPGEMHQAFNFDFLLAGWNARRMAKSIDESLTAAASVGAPSTWVLSNHDTIRHPTRFGLADPTSVPKGIGRQDEQPDESLGLARARAATLIMLALPGSAYLYQGEELGLPEHTELDHAARQDPAYFRTGGEERGRDGCRVPLPWNSQSAGFGFGPDDAAEPWLPQPESFGRYAVDRQDGVPGSTLEFYRSALSHRARFQLGTGVLVWSPANKPGSGVLSFTNGQVLMVANLSTDSIDLPPEHQVIISSGPDALDGSHLSPNAAVWMTPRS